MTSLALTGCRVFDGEQMLDGRAVILTDGLVERVVDEGRIPGNAEKFSLGGGILAPGFIDVQVNGGGGALLNHNPCTDTVRRIADSHRQFGTTGMLPTVITDSEEILKQAIAAVAAARSEGMASILGIHVEGPFLDLARKGAHDETFIREMTLADVELLAAADCGKVMLTVAPNRVAPAMIAELARRGILVSLGHSEATFEEASTALAAGARSFTHLFNAMSQMSGREPGMVGAALASAEAYVGIIADGHHVHPEALKIALAAKRGGRFMLVTDAMPAAAGGPDEFALQGRKVKVKHGRLVLADGTLAGSNLTMDEAVRYCVHHLGVPLETALAMASRIPAEFLRLDGRYGRIAHGFSASLVHLDDGLIVQKTWVDGT